MSTYLADLLRTIAANPRPQHTHELLAIAVQVERLERCLDETVRDARADACAIPRITRSRSTDARS
jgi:hypothetical protein